jgi:8-oxo-dGTP pyrophosphatase MutT (NUDIX family)
MLYLNQPENFTPKFEVVSCFCEYNKKFLVLLRVPSSPQPNTWGMVAGKIDEGEQPQQAISREVGEETGIHASPEQFQLEKKTYIKYPEYDYIYYIFKLNLAELPQIALDPNEHQAYQWVSPDEGLALENQMEDLDTCIKLCYPQRQTRTF